MNSLARDIMSNPMLSPMLWPSILRPSELMPSMPSADTTSRIFRKLGIQDLMNCNILENRSDFIIEAEVPGIQPNEVEVNMDGNLLSIRAKKEKHTEDDDTVYHQRELLSGKVERMFELPKNADVDKATVKLMDGLLTITVPKKIMPQPESTMRSLPIETSSEGMKPDFYMGNAKGLKEEEKKSK